MQGKNANRDKKQSGGLVRGPGTGTSDSIQKDVAPGSFIMPADSTQALGLGQKMPVNLSNGEYEIPPEQVQAVGIQALTQAKDATHAAVPEPRGIGRELFFVNGGVVPGYSDDEKRRAVQAAQDRNAQQRALQSSQPGVSAGYSSFSPARDLQVSADQRAQRNAVTEAAKPGPMVAEQISRKDAGLAPAYQQRHFPQQPSGQPLGLSRPGELQPGIAQVSTPIPAKPPALQSTINAATAPVMKAEIVSRKDAGLPPIYQQRHPQPHPNQFDEKRSRALLAQNTIKPQEEEYGLGDRARDLGNGVVNTAVGGAKALVATPLDMAHQGIVYAAGGDVSTMPGGGTGFRDNAFNQLSEGGEQLSASVDGTGAAVRDVLGVQARRDQSQQVASDKAVDPAQASQDPTKTTNAPAAGQPAGVTGNGYGNVNLSQRDFGPSYGENSKIVGRTNAQGVTEFSNAAEDVAGAQGDFVPRGLRPQGNAPAGSTLVASGTNQPIEDQSLAKTGSAANIGNGKGTFSVMGQEGDAQRAIATYDRANEQRRQTIAASRRGGIGEGGGRVSVVRDSERGPQISEIVSARMDQQQARGLREDQIAQRTQSRLDQTAAENSAKHQQDMEIGGLGLNANRQLEAIKEQLANPNLPEDQRKQLLETYNTLTISAKDRYMEIRGGENEQGYQKASTYLDKATGRQGGQGSTPKTATKADVADVVAKSGKSEAEVLKLMADRGYVING